MMEEHVMSKLSNQDTKAMRKSSRNHIDITHDEMLNAVVLVILGIAIMAGCIRRGLSDARMPNPSAAEKFVQPTTGDRK